MPHCQRVDQLRQPSMAASRTFHPWIGGATRRGSGTSSVFAPPPKKGSGPRTDNLAVEFCPTVFPRNPGGVDSAARGPEAGSTPAGPAGLDLGVRTGAWLMRGLLDVHDAVRSPQNVR